MKGPFESLNDRFPKPFIYIVSRNPYPFKYLKREKSAPFGWSLPVWAIIGRNFSPRIGSCAHANRYRDKQLDRQTRTDTQVNRWIDLHLLKHQHLH